MNEKTKKILKVSAIALGEMALLTLGFAVGACSAKAGTKQQTAITTPVAKSLLQRPKKAVTDLTGTKWLLNDTIMGERGSSGYQIDFISNSTNYVRFRAFWIPSSVELGAMPNQLSYYYSVGGSLNEEVVATGNSDITQHVIDNWYNQAYRTIEITGGEDVTNSSFVSWLEVNAIEIQQTPDPDPDPEPTPTTETKEKVVLNSSYDFRRWFGNVDPTTGAIQFKLPTGISLYSVRVGGLEWENLGNERIYNCIEFTLQPLNASNALAVSDNLAKTAESLYGDKYTDFCMLSGVYYSYQSGYDGTYTVIQDSALPSVDYRDRIYSMPMVSAQLDGTSNNVNALDIRNCVIPSIYRSFGIIEDSEIVFSTNGYSSVTLRQLLGMDFSSVVNYSEGTASAFSLLTQAFGSVAGLLAVQVLPNITLGLLLFLPLIAAVIVLIIKAVKK